MGNKLTSNITSNYINAANKLYRKDKKERVIAYVESYDDIIFWRNVLSPFETKKRFIEVMLPSKKTLTKGKRAVLMNILHNNTGENMIACVDADYDYLLQGKTLQSRQMLENKYVLHTYAYAIENLQCYSPSLHDVCVMVTLNDKRSIFDFDLFFKTYSKIIYPLFVWNIFIYKKGNYEFMTITDFNRIITCGNINIHNTSYTLNKLKEKVDRKVRQFEREFKNDIDNFQKLKKQLEHLGVRDYNTYMYIQGHHLFDNVVVPLLSKICAKLHLEQETQIRVASKHGLQLKNELSAYNRSTEDVISMLRRNTGYSTSFQFQQIKKDIENLFNIEVKTDN